jgi:hypothetical protein
VHRLRIRQGHRPRTRETRSTLGFVFRPARRTALERAQEQLLGLGCVASESDELVAHNEPSARESRTTATTRSDTARRWPTVWCRSTWRVSGTADGCRCCCLIARRLGTLQGSGAPLRFAGWRLVWGARDGVTNVATAGAPLALPPWAPTGTSNTASVVVLIPTATAVPKAPQVVPYRQLGVSCGGVVSGRPMKGRAHTPAPSSLGG